MLERQGSIVTNTHERNEGIPSTQSKQIIFIRADQLLNLTITKTGLDLVQRLSTMFNNVYNKRLPSMDDDHQPMLALFNGTGKNLQIHHLEGLEVKKFLQDILRFFIRRF